MTSDPPVEILFSSFATEYAYQQQPYQVNHTNRKLRNLPVIRLIRIRPIFPHQFASNQRFLLRSEPSGRLSVLLSRFTNRSVFVNGCKRGAPVFSGFRLRHAATTAGGLVGDGMNRRCSSEA
ncbi:hypothetical protein HanXRQr2_Chr17g0808171 [Helianthus annuus]|uniref:Uncharacterized protein n=1 Tax=Helianthus annuus TaxID=4232 RepID=A0A9K3DIA0_HELAN|nr:hypothetical protein HanXRQr2_Chr17g0808171 [Helianthus annuus]KAJ0813624.1 hypothetical protein HanPSC8_Chr17g0775681 [Helianthus annuus]